MKQSMWCKIGTLGKASLSSYTITCKFHMLILQLHSPWNRIGYGWHEYNTNWQRRKPHCVSLKSLFCNNERAQRTFLPSLEDSAFKIDCLFSYSRVKKMMVNMFLACIYKQFDYCAWYQPGDVVTYATLRINCHISMSSYFLRIVIAYSTMLLCSSSRKCLFNGSFVCQTVFICRLLFVWKLLASTQGIDVIKTTSF